ncbi:hypothetical protein EI555_004829 [Monodon monoceros]|uniref:Uncharacterized protein n=1 Tax=Monodon monoceros TaxID=40151 RepID=A0A4V5P7C5_MONMO|nr:hypothetical protein EI555_004829 [Monodon monoceros]
MIFNSLIQDLKCPLRHKELMTVQALVEEVLMETNVKVSSKSQKESKFSPRKRRGKYPAKQLLNCQLVLKEFRRNLQKLRWTRLPTVVSSNKPLKPNTRKLFCSCLNGKQLFFYGHVAVAVMNIFARQVLDIEAHVVPRKSFTQSFVAIGVQYGASRRRTPLSHQDLTDLALSAV